MENRIIENKNSENKNLENKDYCMRAISEDGSVKLWIARTTNLCE